MNGARQRRLARQLGAAGDINRVTGGAQRLRDAAAGAAAGACNHGDLRILAHCVSPFCPKLRGGTCYLQRITLRAAIMIDGLRSK